VKTETIEIVDRGRGPQLSTSRITVQDVVPYLQKHYTCEQIREIIPVLTVEEFQVVEKYVQEHYEEVMAQDRRIRERAAARRKPPEEEEAERKERCERLEKVRQLIQQGKQEPNGDLTSR
jgi:uncharacterized protein (DUF433 family)